MKKRVVLVFAAAAIVSLMSASAAFAVPPGADMFLSAGNKALTWLSVGVGIACLAGIGFAAAKQKWIQMALAIVGAAVAMFFVLNPAGTLKDLNQQGKETLNQKSGGASDIANELRR